jgi:hypothetical protein
MKTQFGQQKAEQNTSKMELAQEGAKEMKSEFIQAITEKQKKFQEDTDMEFFICIAFQNRTQKEQFIKAKGWDKLGDKYYAGLEIAKIEKVNLTVDMDQRKAFKFKPQPNTMK